MAVVAVCSWAGPTVALVETAHQRRQLQLQQQHHQQQQQHHQQHQRQLLDWSSFVQQPDGSRGLLVPLAVAAGVPRDQPWRQRRLQKLAAISPVLGAVKEGYFYAQLSIGTPPRTFSTIIDTGSTITYIPCSRCQHCGTHMAAAFDPDKSSTAHWLGCSDAQCQCGSPACGCREQTCYYTRHYAEASSSEGWMLADKLHLQAVTTDDGRTDGSSGASSGASNHSSSGSSGSSSSIDFVFGCENAETGEIYKQRVDGVLGMGNNANAFPRQLSRSGLLRDVFSLCYGFPEGGSMLLGAVLTQPVVRLAYTPLLSTRNNYYTIETRDLSLGGKALGIEPADFAVGYGTVLDSGTTFTYFPTRAYTAFLGALKGAIAHSGLKPAPGADPSFNDLCWRGAPKDWKGLEDLFPRGNITFAGGAHIPLLPHRYLFAVEPGVYCLGVFDNGRAGTLLGGIITRNVLVQYDKEGNRVGMGEAACNDLKAATAHATAGHGATAAGASAPPTAAGAVQPRAPPPAPAPQARAGDSAGDASAGAGDAEVISSHGTVQAPSGGDDAAAARTQGGAQEEEEEAGAGQADEEEEEEDREQQYVRAGASGQQQGSGGSSSSSFGARHTGGGTKVLWLGLAVAGVVALVMLQLAYVTFRQRPGADKGGSGSGAAASGAGGAAAAAAAGRRPGGSAAGLLPVSWVRPPPHRSYQQLGTAEDEQELVDFAQRSPPQQQRHQQQPQQQPPGLAMLPLPLSSPLPHAGGPIDERVL